MFAISKLMGKIAAERQLFHSEADFQHAFAWEVHKQLSNAVIRLEYRFPAEKRVLHLDCWLEKGAKKLAVELKYKTCLLDALVGKEKYQLANHSAHDCGRYDFIKDIQRLEKVVATDNSIIGYAILLTNDSAYWLRSKNADTVDSQFRLHEGRILNGILKWGKMASKGTMRSRETPIQLLGKYPLQWRDFSELENKKTGKFRYLSIVVSQ